MQAVWKGVVIASSADTLVVEGNHYFPMDTLVREYVRESDTQTVCSWKGTASYFDVVVEGEVNRDAAWYYPSPLPGAGKISGCVAFWRGVEVGP